MKGESQGNKKTPEAQVRFVGDSSEAKRVEVVKLVNEFIGRFEPIEKDLSELLVFVDLRTGAHYCECHIRASKFDSRFDN